MTDRRKFLLGAGAAGAAGLALGAPAAAQPSHEIIMVAPIEGSSVWVPWEEWQKLRVPDQQGKRVHALMFADGRVWDAHNGIRIDRPGYRFTKTPKEIEEYRQHWRALSSDPSKIQALRQEHIVFRVYK